MNIKQDFAESFSLSFHPLLIPFYSLMFVFVLPIFEVQALGLSFQISILVITALSTIILPLASMFILRNQNSISSFAIPERKERSKPYIFTMIFFGITAYMLGRISFIPSIIPLVLFIPVLSIFTLLLINLFIKVSAHMAGMGSLSALMYVLMQAYDLELIIPLVVSIVLSIIVALSRYYLKAHTWFELVLGFIIGISITWSLSWGMLL